MQLHSDTTTAMVSREFSRVDLLEFNPVPAQANLCTIAMQRDRKHRNSDVRGRTDELTS